MNDSPVQLFFDDFVLGQKFSGASRLVSQHDVIAFSELTGDKHPIHYDADYASKTRFGRPIVHGLHLMSLSAVGASALSDQIVESMIAFVEQGCRFLRPVFVGDTVTSRYEVAELLHERGKDWGTLKLKSELVNDKDEVILDAFHAYRLRCRNPAGGAG
ncbi:MaoC family dehydratase [Pseudorhodoplanes sp.]|uniref:MaoC family dehydratase n=1 Tax=Pseudorhodoplanes sp. TaxID=1934341 RepID=UPI003D11D978